MEQRKHRIICCNDSIEATFFGLEAEAKAKMEDMAAEYFHRNQHVFHEYQAYREQCYWHLHDAPHHRGKGLVKGYEISLCLDDGENCTALKWECDTLSGWRTGITMTPEDEAKYLIWTLYIRGDDGLAYALFDHPDRDTVLALYQQLTGVQYEWVGDNVTADLPAHPER